MNMLPFPTIIDPVPLREHSPDANTLSLLRGSIQVRHDDIVRLEGDRNYTRFILADGRKILTSRNISFYEPLLPEYFVRVHKRHLLNRRYVSEQSKRYMRMSDGVEVEVARRKRSIVKAQNAS